MKKYGSKFALIIGLTLLGLYAIIPPREKLKTGIDLSGGTILQYEVNQNGAAAGNVNIDDLITALKRRINPEGVLDIPIRRIGNTRIEVILPKASPDEVEEVKRKMTNVGSLEFRILANHKHDSAVIDRALGPKGLANPPSKYRWAKLGETFSGNNPTTDSQGTLITDLTQRWVKNILVGRTAYLSGKNSAGLEQADVAIPIESNTNNTFKLQKAPKLATVTSYRIEHNPSRITGGNPLNPFPTDPITREEKTAGHVERYVLYKVDKQEVTGKLLASAQPQQDDHYQPAVGFVFNRTGGRKFGELTRNHLPEEGGNFKYQLAILLDGVVQSAPSINQEIGASGIIEGGPQGFSPKELDLLITVLRSGSLPASLNPEPLQEENVGPTLGDDTITKGVRAIIISMIVVPVFMIIYYRFAGVVAVIALMLNVLLLIASMSMSALQVSFTLPGLAGLALTIGMAVDVNVLIFERMREEAERGASLAQQIRNGFNRAWVTIFDSHVTIFLSGLVLFFVATDEVKGFAVTLIIGMIWNLFTAVFVSRVIFEFCYDQGWLKKITMMKMMDKSNIDFIRPRKLCMTASVILIALGLLAVYGRGVTMYNIDFTGGTLVTIRLNENDPQIKDLTDSERSNFVRSRAHDLPDVTIESLSIGGEKSGERFNIRTTEQKIDKVKEVVLNSFGTALKLVELTVGPPVPIVATTSTEPAKADAKEKAKEELKAPTDRYAGGRQYDLTFNLPQSASMITTSLGNVLNGSGINNPATHFEILNPKATPGAATVPDSNVLTFRTNLEPDVAKAQLAKLATALKSDRNLLFERSETFGSTVAGETQTLAIVATVASWLIIALYLWFRFKSLVYGLAAIIAVVHDVLITLGAVAVTYWLSNIPVVSQFLLLEPFKIDLPMIAAFLTLIGFSVNDTIVIFDRIRELKGKTPYLTSQMINDALNQTLSRTILTSLTAWLVVVILYVAGGEGLHGFAFSLVVGFLSGTYSTIYIASPILIDWDRKAVETPHTGKELVGSR